MNIINNLSEGYRLLGRHLYLLVVPVLLDIYLWRMPQFSIGELLQQVVDFYIATVENQNLTGELRELVTQSSENLNTLGESFNLLGLLVSRQMMHVPNIMLYAKPSLDSALRQIRSPSDLLLLIILLGLLSLLIGVVYMRMLVARFVSASMIDTATGENSREDNERKIDKSEVDKSVEDLPSAAGLQPTSLQPISLAGFVKDSGRQWIRIVFFCFIMACVLLALYIPISFVIIFMMVLSPALGAFGAMLLSAAAFMLFFYLYFATIGMVLDDLAIFEAVTRSFKLMRQNFWAAIGIIMLIYFINQGIGMLLQQVVIIEPIGTIAAILCNAYIGTGLVLALLHFYRERIMNLERPDSVA